ncbi:MAG: hypothetical protein V3T31_05520, partial [candidate division Zixibacteria bacterium]
PYSVVEDLLTHIDEMDKTQGQGCPHSKIKLRPMAALPSEADIKLILVKGSAKYPQATLEPTTACGRLHLLL